MNTTVIKNKNIILLISIIELIFIMIVFKSLLLSYLLFAALVIIFILFLYPEFGLSLALTSNILIRLTLDFLSIEDISSLLLFIQLLILGTGVFFYKLKNGPDEKFYLNKLICISIFIGFLMWSGLYYSKNYDYGLYKATYYIFYNLPLIIIPFIFRHEIYKSINIIKFVCYLGIVLGIISTVMASHFPFNERFIPSENVNAIWLARSLGISILSTLFILNISKRYTVKLICLLSILIMLYPILRTGSRAPFFGLVIAVILYYFYQPDIKRKYKLIIFSLLLLLLLTFLLITQSVLFSRIVTPDINDLTSTFSRIAAWENALHEFFSSPMVGIGTGSYYYEFLYITIFYPHNIFLELLSESGIFGFLSILLFCILSIKYALNNIKYFKILGMIEYIKLSIVLFTIFFFSIWNAMFSGDIVHNGTVWLSAGLIIALYDSRDKYRLKY